MQKINRSEFLAECVGTFLLVLVGTGAIIINDVSQGAITHLGIAISFGLIVSLVIYCYGDISGAHINPAVSLGFYFAKRFPLHKLFVYWVAQFLGAIAASALLKVMFSSHATLGSTISNGSVWACFVFEVILTWFLMTVILRVAHGAKEEGIIAGSIIGATVFLEALFAGPLTGASMNPARSLAPALFSQNLNTVWLYLIAPSLGAVLAVYTCKAISGDECCSRELKL